MYKRCVTLEDIEVINSGECKYNLNDKTYSYYPSQFDSNTITIKDIKSNSNNHHHPQLQSLLFSSFDSISFSYIYDLCNPDLKIKEQIFQNM